MKSFRSILYVAEEGGAQGPAVTRAVTLAENNQADLTIMAVMAPLEPPAESPPGVPIAAETQAAAVAERRRELDDLAAPFRERVTVRPKVAVGTRFLEVIRAVLRDGHDLVIKSAENPERLQRLFGSDDAHLLRKCPCPVWLMKPAEKPNYDCIMAAVDVQAPQASPAGAELNLQITELAGSLAVSDFAALHLVHAWEAPAETLVRATSDRPDEARSAYVDGELARRRAGMAALCRLLRARIGRDAYEHIAPRTHLARGSAKTVIPETAVGLGADLVVMGTVARTGIPGLIIGNTAEAILDQIHCAVLAVKPPGFVSPVTLEP